MRPDVRHALATASPSVALRLARTTKDTHYHIYNELTGRCYRCGKRAPLVTSRLCSTCRDYFAAYKRAAYRREHRYDPLVQIAQP